MYCYIRPPARCRAPAVARPAGDLVKTNEHTNEYRNKCYSVYLIFDIT